MAVLGSTDPRTRVRSKSGMVVLGPTDPRTRVRSKGDRAVRAHACARQIEMRKIHATVQTPSARAEHHPRAFPQNTRPRANPERARRAPPPGRLEVGEVDAMHRPPQFTSAPCVQLDRNAQASTVRVGPVCGARSHTRAQFHGEPRVNLVSISHPETPNRTEFMPRPSSCMCCWRGARVHACTIQW